MVDNYIKLIENHISSMQHELHKLKEDVEFARRNYIEEGALPEQYMDKVHLYQKAPLKSYIGLRLLSLFLL